MKYLIGTLLLLSIAFAVSIHFSQSQKEGEPYVNTMVQSDLHKNNLQRSESHTNLNEEKTVTDPQHGAIESTQKMKDWDKIVTQLDQLNRKLKVIDQELEKAGYPKVMLDERLSESDREQIIGKLLAASQLQERISLLNLQKIDLQAGL